MSEVLKHASALPDPRPTHLPDRGPLAVELSRAPSQPCHLTNGTPFSPIDCQKDGTSLSKAYSLISRFSEDIDLTLDRHDLGFIGERDPANAKSNKTQKALLDELEACAIEAVGGPVKAALSQAMSDALGEPVLLETSDDDPQMLIFTHPASLPATAALPYGRSSVRLEFGARSDHLPAEQQDIFPFVHEQFADLFSEPGLSLKTLSAARTVWEKARSADLQRVTGCQSCPAIKTPFSWFHENFSLVTS